jgi:hypothetical protein
MLTVLDVIRLFDISRSAIEATYFGISAAGLTTSRDKLPFARLAGVDLVRLTFIAANAKHDFIGTITIKVEMIDQYYRFEIFEVFEIGRGTVIPIVAKNIRRNARLLLIGWEPPLGTTMLIAEVP